MDEKGGGGLSELSVEKFLSHSTETIRRGTILCCVSDNFWWRKSLWERRGEGQYRKFPSKIFFLRLPKPFVGEPFSLSLVSGIEIVYASKSYVTLFRRKFFVPNYRNIS